MAKIKLIESLRSIKRMNMRYNTFVIFVLVFGRRGGGGSQGVFLSNNVQYCM